MGNRSQRSWLSLGRSLPKVVICTAVTLAVFDTARGDSGGGDFTNDCTVNIDDFAVLESCLDGPVQPYQETDCWRADFDGDDDVDLLDFAGFQDVFNTGFEGSIGACCLPDDTCPQMTCAACVAASGLFAAPDVACCDLVVCCQADMRMDSDNDGDIDEYDEAIEHLPPGVILAVNTDDDDDNGIPDLDEDPVVGEDDLAELRLSSSCVPSNPPSAWWSLSWPVRDPPLIQVWENDDKSSGPIGSPLENDAAYSWPPPAVLWVEALDTFEGELTFTVSVEGIRAVKRDLIQAAASCTFGRKYAYVEKLASATGCSAMIRTRSTMLCGWPDATSRASSNAWVGVQKDVMGLAVQWAQMGYGADREAGSQAIVEVRYAETRWGPLEGERNYFTEETVPAGTHEYRCYLLSPLLGTWQYEYDGLPFHSFSHNNWKNVKGTECQYAGEIFNKEDQMVGTESAKCDFTQCQYSVNWGSFQNASIGTGDLHTDDETEWGIERVSSTAFNIWDKKP